MCQFTKFWSRNEKHFKNCPINRRIAWMCTIKLIIIDANMCPPNRNSFLIYSVHSLHIRWHTKTNSATPIIKLRKNIIAAKKNSSSREMIKKNEHSTRKLNFTIQVFAPVEFRGIKTTHTHTTNTRLILTMAFIYRTCFLHICLNTHIVRIQTQSQIL